MSFLRRFASASLVAATATYGLAACILDGQADENPQPSESSAPDGAATDGSTGDAQLAPLKAPSDVAACPATVDVASAEDVYALVRALPTATDSTLAPSAGAALRPTADVRTTSRLTLEASALGNLAPACALDAGPFDLCRPLRFAAEKPRHGTVSAMFSPDPSARMPAGVTCADSRPDGTPADACSAITLEAGTVVRFQHVVEVSVMSGTRWHFVRVVRPCTETCAEGEVPCAASLTCLRAGESSCRICEGSALAVCACRDEFGKLAEGARCSFDGSDDGTVTGKCSAGTCVVRR